jgi:hypothetical protein
MESYEVEINGKTYQGMKFTLIIIISILNFVIFITDHLF